MSTVVVAVQIDVQFARQVVAAVTRADDQLSLPKEWRLTHD